MNYIIELSIVGEKRGIIYPPATLFPRSFAPQDINSLMCMGMSKSYSEPGLTVNRKVLG